MVRQLRGSLARIVRFEVAPRFRIAMKRTRRATRAQSESDKDHRPPSGDGRNSGEEDGASSTADVTVKHAKDKMSVRTVTPNRKPSKKSKKTLNVTGEGELKNPYHFFTDPKDVQQFREHLLRWYDANKRDLPWRKWASNPDMNQRAYGVWVSEIMLQQTQVATVIDYYNRWMEKWPTLQDLASSATAEEVNEMWAGLGYYSRGRRLYEGAKKVREELSGVMPSNAESLMRQLPGVGRYTAGAIASIAFNQPTGVVDGNVIRVLSRARAIGADSTAQTAQSAFWSLADALVDRDRPGDFNQAMMELGAMICTPKAPSCAQCPIKNLCRAFQHEEHLKRLNEDKLKTSIQMSRKPQSLPDIECAADCCKLCVPADEAWNPELGVINFPRKPRKKPPRIEQTAVCIIQRQHPDQSEPDYLIVQRPDKGLLAGLWEFPSVRIEEEMPTAARQAAIDAYLMDDLKISLAARDDRHSVGEVLHIFSHIEQTYLIETFTVPARHVVEGGDVEVARPYKWLIAEDFRTAAVSTAMKKCFRAFEQSTRPAKANTKKKKVDSGSGRDGKRQLALEAFFKPAAKKRR